MEFGKKLTNEARDTLASAEIFARSNGAEYIGTEHLLLGILNQNTTEAAHILLDAGVTFEQMREQLRIAKIAVVNPLLKPTRGFSETAKLALRMSIELANEFNQDFCTTEHLLFSLLNQRDSRAMRALKDAGADIDKLMDEMSEYFREDQSNTRDYDGDLALGTRDRQTKSSFLSKFSRNLTTAAKKGELDPVIGRDQEIERLIVILLRRQKNNPVLIGEAGVGKTAIVEGLAERIVENNVPKKMRDKEILQLDLAGLVAGTKFRGEFEERLKRVIDEVSANKNLILFLDEMHLLAGAGVGEGSMDAANILKPALSRGGIRLIGATTNDEYRKDIEKDAALARRFQTIEVAQPNLANTVKIVEGLREKYENHHNVKLNDKVIEEAARLADRYLTERFQPDKTLDVIDEASARTRVEYEKRHNRINAAVDDLAKMKSEKKSLIEKTDAAAAAENYEKAALYKMRVSRLDEQIVALEKTQSTDSRISLKTDDIAQTVAWMTGVPVDQLSRNEAAKVLNLEKNLSRRIVGQQRAIAEISRSIRRSRAGIASGRRPIGSFIFLGPTGVGKTETARALAREVFGGEQNLIKIDMSEFSESHMVARLTGAPAGYVGYDDGGTLTEKVRRQPYSVVLFDEIEKAHPRVFNLLLQILEDGKLTDGKGKTVDFSNTIIILTSNVGAAEMLHDTLGFGGRKEESSHAAFDNMSSRDGFDDIPKALRETMRPELLNRFDAIVEFHQLNKTEVGQIFDLMVNELNGRLIAKGVTVSFTKSAKDYLIEHGYDAKFGARPLRRVVQHEVEDLLAEKILQREIGRGDVVRIVRKNGQLAVERISERANARRDLTTSVSSKNATMISNED